MSYRDDLDAAQQRADALQRELDEARSSRDVDADRIKQLEAQLAQARANPYQAYYPYPPPLPQSNATMVLVFGILSLVLCTLFGPFAWYYGNLEIQRMDAGLVDPSGRSSAVAGKVCGIIATSFMIFGVFIIMLVMLAAAS
ncbi:MAG TPA: hypothetical protein VL172_18565 [Kofleriaceae bacterium]|nr:hypothetical protein [Kofleriaceae bacterium]